MDRINKIFHHPVYQDNFNQIQEYEKDRIFCNHTLEHFLDVARLMYIKSLENGDDLPKELIYAVALLHDIGRAQEYKTGISHDLLSVDLAQVILFDCGFSDEEAIDICYAIMGHRQSGDGKDHTRNITPEGNIVDTDFLDKESFASKLAMYLYEADKKSRKCYECKAYEQCKWPIEKRNLEIVV